MKLPGGEFAVVDVAKLRDYCLDPEHPRGRHKARVFRSALGLGRTDADFVRGELLLAATRLDAVRGTSDQFGDRYMIDLWLKRNDRTARVRSGWIIRKGDDSPRLTTCFVIMEVE